MQSLGDKLSVNAKVYLQLTAILALLLILLAFVPHLQASGPETRDESFDFKTGGTIKIDGGLGQINVEVWAEELVHVVAKKVVPADRSISQSDISFINTKNQMSIKVQPSDATTRIDLDLLIPRNTNLRINTTTGVVLIRGSIASAVVETKTGNIKLEAPSSLDADIVLTTTQGAIKAALPITTYAPPTTKVLQGKLNSGGNPVILRSTEGNIELAALENELDKGIATIPSAPPPSSSSDNNTNYYDNSRNNRSNNSSNDTLFGNNNTPTVRRRNDNATNSQPYTYGGSYGGSSGGNTGGNTGNSGGSLSGNNKNKANPKANPNSNNSNNSSSNNANGGNKPNSNNSQNTDIFGGGRGTDDTDTTIDAGNLGASRNKNNSSTDSQGGVGIRIIPPPGSNRPQNNNSQPNYNNTDNYNNSQPIPNQPPPLQRRKPASDNSGTNNSDNPPNSNDDINQNRPNYNRPDTNGDNNNVDNDVALNPRNPDNRSTTLKGTNPDTPPVPKSNRGDRDDDTIKIDTKLVALNVSVVNRDGRALTNLKGSNFQVFEDGIEQQISSFESVNSPFNLVIMIDLSGSIIDKIDILRRAILRFIDISRPEDKVAIVTFTRSIQVVSDLTNDRQLLHQRVQYMQAPRGGTAFYEAMWFTLDQIIKPIEGERNAIVLLSDGVDNSISLTYPIPSRVSYEQVLRRVQESGTLVFPIYLDTEAENVSQNIESSETYVLARRQLGALAESSGGVFFKAEKPQNLEGVYEKVVADLRTLYSVSYYPTNPNRDGNWRKIKVKVDKSDVAVRTRRGYYAK